MNVDIVNLEIALKWLKSFIEDCLYSRLKKPSEIEIKSLSFYSSESWLTEFIEKYNPCLEEFVILLLAIVPHLQPHFFNKLISEFLPEGGDFPEFGGVKGTNHRGILPTGETAQFILAGDDLEKRLEVQKIFNDDHWFAKQKILRLDPVPEGEPIMSGRLVLDPEIVEWLTLGTVSKPRFSIDFPAEYIETEMAWDDLVLPPSTLKQIREIEHWIEYNDTLLQDWGMKKKIKPGYRALFYGPPGTGKTLTATLLGKQTGKDVFRIDLSRVVSKYIGETEKNLSRLFDKAENKDWILFFDEADALFGKRTDIRDAHDKYANQEVAYLLQRIENYNGLVILASNQRANIDEAFVRRFQAIIHFPMPGADERYEIWRKTIPEQLEVHIDIDWRQVANRYELSGASILNVTHYCAVEIIAAQSARLDLKRLETAIQREFIKEGKVV
ncbi:MAG: ATP-binding protein [Gammaproteobacteria bacterium]|nr:ATP-binding protein [Gammaproteobacteria bacterium]